MSQFTENNSIPNINLDSSKSQDVYEINAGVLIAIIAVVVIIVAGVIFLKFRSTATPVAPTPTPTPMQIVTESPTPTMTLTPTPSTTVKDTSGLTAKQKVKIQVLNGTGVTGDAAYLKAKLISAGYQTIDTGNAAETSASAETKVTYYSSFPATYKVDFTTLLNDLYASVSATSSTDTGKYDVIVTSGKKK